MAMSNLSAKVTEPLLATTSGTIYENIFDYHHGQYSHDKKATIGYDTMNMDIITPDTDTRDWITNGLGRHIEVTAPSGVVWEGFVNQLSVSTGLVKLDIGPLMDIANRIKVTYTTRTYNTNPPIGGDAAETAFATNTASDANWGTFELVVSGGEGELATMEAMRASKLNELSWPKISNALSSGSPGPSVISISCLGYYHMMSRYLFDSATANTGTVNISEKLADVLDEDPDSLFSSSNATIETNTLQVPDFDDGNRKGLDVLQELVGLGFASGQRALLSVGAGRHVTYQSLALDKEPIYVYSIYDDGGLYHKDASPVKPWDIRTGEWIEIEAITAQPFDSSLPRHSDPKYIFIEGVSYSAPIGFSIQGGLGNTLKEKIGKFGLTFSRG